MNKIFFTKSFFLICLLFCSSNALAQDKNIQLYRDSFVKFIVNPRIDYTKDLSDTSLPLNFDKNLISPNFAVQLYKEQENRFEYVNRVFYWNEVAIHLFDEIEDIKKYLPSNDYKEDGNSLRLANSIRLDFTEYEGKKYLVNINFFVSSLHELSSDKFGIFLIDGFPVNSKTTQREYFRMLIEKLTEHVNYGFHYTKNYTYSSSELKVDVKNINILANYFEPVIFKRTINKKIYVTLKMSEIMYFSTGISYDGLDPEYIRAEAPSATINNSTDHLVYNDVDKTAQYQGETSSLQNYLAKNIDFNDYKLNKGSIYISFTIEKDGYITNKKIENCSDENLKNRIFELIRKMPKWIPAEKDGKIVRSRFTKGFIIK